jgi:aminoglycoside 6'-N-acetyltransferase I
VSIVPCYAVFALAVAAVAVLPLKCSSDQNDGAAQTTISQPRHSAAVLASESDSFSLPSAPVVSVNVRETIPRHVCRRRPMLIRAARPHDMPQVLEMMRALTSEEYDFHEETVFVAERPDSRLAGFISMSLRPWAEGCDSTPVPYVEGWWVEPDVRRTGVGRQLMSAAEAWCRAHGHTELGSDAEIENEGSLRAHVALGFERTVRIQFFRRRVD